MSRSVDDKNSRYVHGGSTSVFEKRLGWWERRSLRQDENDLRLVIDSRYHRRPDLLAFDMYGKSSLMWLVLQYNNILDDKIEFVEGKELRLPSRQRVTLEILNKQSGGTIE